MQVITGLDELARAAAGREGRSAVTIGAYDGLHRGHRLVMAELRRRAAALVAGGEGPIGTVVVTFDRHPATVVRPASAPLLLCSEDQKLELLAEQGIDTTVVIPFDEARAKEPAETFVDEILVGALAAVVVVVGENFHFGREREGTVATLAEMGLHRGFDVVGLPLDGDPGKGDPVSSTRIRTLLAAGAVEEAAVLLGRPHEVRGTVVCGQGRGGAELGFPTANLAVPGGILLPANGIYAGWFVRNPASAGDGGPAVLPAAVSVGLRPTFGAGDRTPLVEAHLLDFSGDLYGERAAVRFAERIRDEKAFASAEALAEQIGMDVAAARRMLDLHRTGGGC